MENTTFLGHWKDIGFTTDEEVNPLITEKLFNLYTRFEEKINSINLERLPISRTEYLDADLLHSPDIHYSPFFKGNLVDDGWYSISDKHAESFTRLKGYVTKVFDEYFEAKIYDENLQGTYEIGEFDIKDVDKGDYDLFEEGAIFYWTFGYFKVKGQLLKQSEIRFQRIAIISENEFDEINDRAENLDKSLNWE